MSQTPLPPPGWYPDPQPGPEQYQQPERYWDGSAWTGHTREAGGAPAPPGPGSGAPAGGGAPAWQEQQPYGTPAAAYSSGARQQAGNTLSIIGIVCGGLAFVFCPVLLGPAGIVLGLVGRSKGEPLSTVAIVVGAVGLVIGMAIGFLAFQAMDLSGMQF